MRTFASRRRHSARRGLTLVEIVFATGILSIVLLGVFGAMNAVQRADRLTRERQAASEAAHRMLDTVLSGTVPDAGTPVIYEFPVEVTVAGTPRALTPANPFPTDMTTWAGTANPSGTVAGVAVTRVGVDVVDDDGTDAVNEDLMEVRVVVAWRPADWQVGDRDQRVEVIGRRIR